MVEGASPGFTLLYRNGLLLTLGEAGILDYQDSDFGQFIGGPGCSKAPDNREFLVHLHKIVLKSLLRYITHPGLDLSQRGYAAEAASKLWLASSERPDVRPGPDIPAAARSLKNESWSMGSPRESAPFR